MDGAVTEDDILLYRHMYDDDGDDDAEFFEMNKVLEEMNESQHINTGWEELDRELRECTLSQSKKKEEEEEEANRRLAEERRQYEAERREKIKYRAPGLKAFTQQPFRYFTHDSIDLVKDFGYVLRVQQRGFSSDEALLKILRHPVRFIMFLSPESTSCLIQDSKDFASICDFLFFSLSSFCPVKETVVDHFPMFRKALFDLLRNYGFDSWRLQLSHVIAPLLNLGCDRNVIAKPTFYRTILETPLARVKKSFHLPKMPAFVTENERPHWVPDHDLLKSFFKSYFGVDEEQPSTSSTGASGETSTYEEKLLVLMEDGVEQFFKLLSDLLVSFGSDKSTDALMPRTSDWTNTLVLFIVITTAAMDKNLVLNSEVHNCVVLMLQEIFDSFTSRQWAGCESGVEATEEHARKSACNDLLEAACKSTLLLDDAVKTWTKSEVPPALVCDHHHNLVARIRMIPPSYRGNNFKKDIAFIWLSTIVCPTEGIAIGMDRNIGHVAEFLKENEGAMALLFDDVYVMLSVLRLIDAIVGAEPVVDHLEQYKAPLKSVSRHLGRYVAKLGKGSDEEAYLRARDLFTQVLTKWDRYQEVERPTKRQQSIAKYAVPAH